jgi:flagellar assembly protein FliH
VEPFQWETVPNALLRQAPARFPAAGARPAPDPEESERAFAARLQAEKEQAYRQGEAAGRQAALQRLEGDFQQLARAVEEAAGYKPRLRAQAETDVVQLALAIARRILRRELQVDPEAILGLAKAALERVSLREVTEIRVAPAHVEPLTLHLGRLGAPEAIQVLADPALEPGALLLATRSGLADASAHTQLEEISRGFADVLGAER